MEKREKINFKIQAYLALIPYLGFLIVMLTSFYNIYKVKIGCGRLSIIFSFCLPLFSFRE